MPLFASMVAPVVYFWKKTPFIRLFIPFAFGIILQEHARLPLECLWTSLIFSGILINFFFIIPFFQRFKLSWLDGVGVTILFVAFGALLVWYNNIRHDKNWFGNFYTDNAIVLVSLDEPLVEKTKSLKANANVNYIINGDKTIKVKGKIILYFKKDSSASRLIMDHRSFSLNLYRKLKTQVIPVVLIIKDIHCSRASLIRFTCRQGSLRS